MTILLANDKTGIMIGTFVISLLISCTFPNFRVFQAHQDKEVTLEIQYDSQSPLILVTLISF